MNRQELEPCTQSLNLKCPIPLDLGPTPRSRFPLLFIMLNRGEAADDVQSVVSLPHHLITITAISYH